MTLSNLERIVLALIGFDRYSELSVDTDPGKVADFALLHDCVNMAREEFKINCSSPELLSFGTAIATVPGTSLYSLPADFDIPKAMYYSTIAGQIGEQLTRLYPENLPMTIDLNPLGTPSSYLIAGTAANLIQVSVLPEPEAPGFLLPIYKPVLTALSLSTDEDVILRKYPRPIINFATALAWQIIKKDAAQHDKYYLLGLKDCKQIDLREVSADANPTITPDALLRLRRTDRFTN